MTTYIITDRDRLIELDQLLEERAGCVYNILPSERLWNLVFEAARKLKKESVTLDRLESHARSDDMLKDLIQTCKKEAEDLMQRSQGIKEGEEP